ncbi:hypothetical protein NLU13_1524 [Sarocladium strictum]|uniref:Uncharacterized protein n=1 Tax=Sarocladium strictum TaxID=5046 RepID=A0AA39LBW0_SARSR|nr:hypothetical protein NLU13_1524 [Sarocladium strictum]
MCGPDTSNRPRGGALAALASPASSPSLLHADLAFHTPNMPSCATATHARLTPSATWGDAQLSDLYVVVHSTGDLTRTARDCGYFCQFPLSSTGVAAAHQDGYIELPLQKPLSLEVGNGGIIGRRVSVLARARSADDVVLAEGIVGFNF